MVKTWNIFSLKDKEAGDGKDGDKNKTAAAVDATEMDVMAENVRDSHKSNLFYWPVFIHFITLAGLIMNAVLKSKSW